MVEILGASIPVPKFGLGTGSWIWVLIFIFFAVLLFLGVYLLIQWMTYNRKIVVFENIAGSGWQNTGSDRAKIVKIGDGGEELMYLKKRKVYRTAYGKKMGTNTYWFAVGQDGYWYNVVLGDLDAKMGMLDIEPIDRDMRYMHVAIRKNIQERYRKVGLMEKYGTIIMSSFFLLIMIIAIWLLISKVGDLIAGAQAALIAMEPLANKMASIAGNMDKICNVVLFSLGGAI